MMIIKFATVAGYFMHLKYDNPIFRRVFIFGLILAVIVYAIFGVRDGVLERRLPQVPAVTRARR